MNRGEFRRRSSDGLQRLMLDEVLTEFGVTDLPDEERARLASVWAAMDPSPDAVSGLTCIKRRAMVSALSNGDIRQMVGTARHAGLPWDLSSAPSYSAPTNRIRACTAGPLTCFSANPVWS